MCLLEVKIRSLAKTEKGKYPQEQEFSEGIGPDKAV